MDEFVWGCCELAASGLSTGPMTVALPIQRSHLSQRKPVGRNSLREGDLAVPLQEC